jgi:fermentation-respiration switch protein FrsA (DUF1100 family)
MESRDTKQVKPRSWRKSVRRMLILYVVVPYFSVTAIFVIFQRSLMYRPTVASSLALADVGLPSEVGRDVQIQTTDGCTLKGWLIRGARTAGRTNNAPLVIYFPGNAGNRFERLNDLREVAATGFDVLIFDYRGFGDSTGRPAESALTGDARLCWEYACSELKYDPSRIVVFGESLGGAVALSLCSGDSKPAAHPVAVILNSTFTSMPDVVAGHLPWFPFRYLLLDRWRSIDRIPTVSQPVILFHGTADAIVPVSQGRSLASRSGNARLIEIPGASHNDIPMSQLRLEFDRLFAAIQNHQDENELNAFPRH